MTDDKLLEEFIKEQFAKDKPKPNAMVGKHGWYEAMVRKFREPVETQEKG